MNTAIHTPEVVIPNVRHIDLYVMELLKAKHDGLVETINALMYKRITNVTAIVTAGQNGEAHTIPALEREADALSEDLIKNRANLAKLERSIAETSQRLAQCAND